MQPASNQDLALRHLCVACRKPDGNEALAHLALPVNVKHPKDLAHLWIHATNECLVRHHDEVSASVVAKAHKIKVDAEVLNGTY